MIRPGNGGPKVNYQYSSGRHRFSVEAAFGDRVKIRRTGKEDASSLTVRFDQLPGKLISLTINRDGEQQTYKGTSLWHLLIDYPEQGRKYLIPLLELVQPNWKLAERAESMEIELLRAAATGKLPSHERWDAHVERLADERFSEREAADRELRAAGTAVLGYLRRLDFTQLDAEQQFRVRRIIDALSSGSTDDTVEQFVPRLFEDPTIWLALLDRPEESTRRLAAERLRAILGEPIEFDPAAEPAARTQQIERIREKVEDSIEDNG
jgi:hypothetical protein